MNITCQDMACLLRPEPYAGWKDKFDFLMSDPFLSVKYNRAERLKQKWSYVNGFMPELIDGPKGQVIDIGPGPGEFLEVCRSLGHGIMGVDAANGIGGMGSEYVQLSRLMHDRQQIPVVYCGLSAWLSMTPDNDDQNAICFNLQGSLEQSLAHHLEGEPHHLHHDCARMRWNSGRPLLDELWAMMKRFWNDLKPGGIVFIYANGTMSKEDDAEIQEYICNSATELGFQTTYRVHRISKFMKPVVK